MRVVSVPKRLGGRRDHAARHDGTERSEGSVQLPLETLERVVEGRLAALVLSQELVVDWVESSPSGIA